MQAGNRGVISTFLKSIDYFGVKPKFSYDGSMKYQTITGGMLSILVGALIIFGFVAFGRDLVEKKSPTLLSSSVYLEEPERYNLNLENFNFFVGVQDKKANYYVDPSIVTVNVIQKRQIRHINSDGSVTFVDNSVTLRVEKCNLNRHFSHYPHLFNEQNLPDLNCIHPEDSEKLYLQGSFGNSEYASLQIQIRPCKNTTDIICKSQKEIEEKIEGGYFVINNIDTIFDPQNYSKVDIKIRRNFFTGISTKYFKTFYLYYKNIDYMTDSGYLISDYNIKKFISLDRNLELFDFRDTSNGYFLCVIRLSYIKEITNRKYIKVQEVIANVGGFIKCLIIIIGFFYNSLSIAFFYVNLANKIYFFKNETTDNASIDPQKKMSFSRIIINNLDNSRNELVTFPFRKSFNTSIIKEKIINYKYKVTFHEYIFYFLSCSKKKSKNKYCKKKLTLTAIVDAICKKCDIYNLLILYEEFEFTKSLILDESQKNLFNLNSRLLIFKPNYESENNCKFENKSFSDLQSNDKIQEIMKKELNEKIKYLNL